MIMSHWTSSVIYDPLEILLIADLLLKKNLIINVEKSCAT